MISWSEQVLPVSRQVYLGPEPGVIDGARESQKCVIFGRLAAPPSTSGVGGNSQRPPRVIFGPIGEALFASGFGGKAGGPAGPPACRETAKTGNSWCRRGEAVPRVVRFPGFAGYLEMPNDGITSSKTGG